MTGAFSDETGRAAIKPLEWQGTFIDRGDGSKDQAGWEADTGFGVWYEIEQYFGSDSYGYRVSFDYEMIGDHDDPDQAKATAQKHFEKRIRAALSASPVGEPLRRIVLDTLNAVAPAVENLSVHQEQCDRDGVMVKVSRQALDEVLNAVNEVAMQSAITTSPASPVAQEPVAYQYRACIAGKWGDWTDLHQSVEGFRNGPWKFGLENGTCELRALYAGTPPATPAGVGAEEIAREILATCKKHIIPMHEYNAAIIGRALALISRGSGSGQK